MKEVHPEVSASNAVRKKTGQETCTELSGAGWSGLATARFVDDQVQEAANMNHVILFYGGLMLGFVLAGLLAAGGRRKHPRVVLS